MNRDKRKNAQRCSRRSRRSVGCGSVILTPRPRTSTWYERVGTDPALLLLRGDPGWSPRTSPAIKRSDKAAMFICRDRGKKKREECRVSQRRRDIPAGRARRQNNKTKDAGGGRRWKQGEEEEDCDQVEKREGRKSKEETDAGKTRPVRPVRMGKESCIADIVDAARKRRGNEGCRDDQKRRKPDRNARTNASCYGLPDRDAYLAREWVSSH